MLSGLLGQAGFFSYPHMYQLLVAWSHYKALQANFFKNNWCYLGKEKKDIKGTKQNLR